MNEGMCVDVSVNIVQHNNNNIIIIIISINNLKHTINMLSQVTLLNCKHQSSKVNYNQYPKHPDNRIWKVCSLN